MDRSDTMSTMGGPVFNEARSVLYESEKKPMIMNYVYGLGGRDVKEEDIKKISSDMEKALKTGKVEGQVTYLGVRE